MKAALKYISIAIVGFCLFVLTYRAASPGRINGSIGGEGCFLFLPLFWYVTERTIKDLVSEFKRLWREAKQERGEPAQAPESDDNGANEKTPRA